MSLLMIQMMLLVGSTAINCANIKIISYEYSYNDNMYILWLFIGIQQEYLKSKV